MLVLLSNKLSINHFLNCFYLSKGLFSHKIIYSQQICKNLVRKVQINTSLSGSERHCIHVVKKYDYESFLVSLLITNKELRRTAFALRALNVELSQVRDLAKSDQLAQIRFKFWQDVIEEIYLSNETLNFHNENRFKNFPIAFELHRVLKGKDLSKHWLLKLISIRKNNDYLSDFPFQTVDELEKYCEASIVSLYYLLNEKTVILNGEKSSGYRITLDHIANHLGKAQGLTNILRGIRHNAAYKRCYIPNDILVKTKSSHQNFLQGQSNEAVCDAIYELASQAKNHLEQTKNLIKKENLIKQDKILFLPRFVIESYLNSLQKCNFNIFDLRLYYKNGILPLKLWWKAKF